MLSEVARNQGTSLPKLVLENIHFLDQSSQKISSAITLSEKVSPSLLFNFITCFSVVTGVRRAFFFSLLLKNLEKPKKKISFYRDIVLRLISQFQIGAFRFLGKLLFCKIKYRNFMLRYWNFKRNFTKFSLIEFAIRKCQFHKDLFVQGMELQYEQEWQVTKSLVICGTQLAGDALLKKLKYLEVMLSISDFSPVWKIVESWLVSANEIFMNRPIIFLNWDNKTKLATASFSCLLDFFNRYNPSAS